jgi:hypothetical protein
MEVKISGKNELEFEVDEKTFRLSLPQGIDKENSLKVIEVFSTAINEYFEDLKIRAEEEIKDE